MDNLKLLRDALALIQKPEGWIKLAMAKDVEGNDVQVFDEQAVCFCSVGALSKVDPSFQSFVTRSGQWKRQCETAQLLGFRDDDRLATWNDHPDRKHEEVVDRFQKAIDRQILLQTKALIEKDGWDQRMNCLGFHLLDVGREVEFHRVRNRLGFVNTESLVEWNDHPDRTKQQVLDLLTKTAEEIFNYGP